MNIKKAVQQKYGELITKNQKEACCPDCCGTQEEEAIPSYGVGNPLEVGNLKEGEKVLDIGSGPGLNCIKAARTVGKTGKVVGLDLTEEMLTAAEENAQKAGLQNISFVKGDAESMPFADNTFDLVISDCVICLIPDKKKVFQEAYRVLKNGGRAVFSDVVSEAPFPEELKQDEKLWCGCITGAITKEEYITLLKNAGFANIETVNLKPGNEVGGIKTFHATFTTKKSG